MTSHLVTGGSGFIGARVAHDLHARGGHVRVLDLLPDPALPEGIVFHHASICDRPAVANALRGVDILHHHAALVAQCNAGKHYSMVNVDGCRIVGEEAVRAGVRLIVHVSSTAIYGMPPRGPITTDTLPRPFEAYGKSKLEGERLMADICLKAQIPLIIIRPRATLGAGRLGIFQILFDWIAEQRRLYIIGDGRNRVQFIHVDDLMSFYMLALARGKSGAFNVGTDIYGTLRDDLAALIEHTGSRSRILGLPTAPAIAVLAGLRALRLSPLTAWQYRTYHRDCCFDIAPLLALGWTPRHSNADMLAESYDWYRGQRAAIVGTSPHRSPLRQQSIGCLRRIS